MLLVFNPNENATPTESNWKVRKPAYELTSPWHVMLNHVDGTVSNIAIDTLEPINQLVEFEYFGGEII